MLPTGTVQKSNGKKVKSGTASTKNHRFEPFAQRIARLKIDPVHRINGSQQALPIDLTKSYFRASLEHWVDLNISSSFTEFSSKASPLCETSPQLLHHADRINELILKYLALRDVLSAEPLLDLLAAFAHDLGSRFEKYFLDAVTLVTSIASTHEAPEVIEWSFTCLAWIFKFLSKLLMPDLRPLLGIMLPYLGSTEQKWFVSRFAAESMVYLLRKAAAQYHKSSEPLEKAIHFLFEALQQASTNRESQASCRAFVILLSETMQGVAGGIHSSGPALFSCLLKCATVFAVSESEELTVVKGALSGVLQQSTSEGALPIATLVTKYAVQLETSGTQAVSDLVAIELMLIMSTSHKGAHIQDWKTFNNTVFHLLNYVASNSNGKKGLIQKVMVLTTQTITSSPIEELYPFLSTIPVLMLEGPLRRYFLFFCSLLAETAVKRFRNFVSSTLQKFVHSYWQEYEAPLLLLLLQLGDLEAIDLDVRQPGHIGIPRDWYDKILESIHLDNNEYPELSLQHARICLVQHTDLPDSTKEAFLSALFLRIRRTLSTGSPTSGAAELTFSSVLRLYVHLAKELRKLELKLWVPLCATMHHNHTSNQFLDGLSDFSSDKPVVLDCSDAQLSELFPLVIKNLLGKRNELKIASLRLLRSIFNEETRDSAQSFDLALAILQTPYNLQTFRQISMMIRKLQSLQKRIASSALTFRAISFFLLGLLSDRLPSIRDDVCRSIATLCETQVGEDVVMPVVVQWLTSETVITSCDKECQQRVDTINLKNLLSKFDCSDMETMEISAARIAAELENPSSSFIRWFELGNRAKSTTNLDLRSLALKVLHVIPNIAEKWSKSIVPFFLSLFQESSMEFADNNIGNSLPRSPSHDPLKIIGSPSDRKDFIGLFGKFVNPKALYRSNDVHLALLNIIATGNSELQQLALKALYLWKSQALRPYEEILLNLTDERKYREELAKVFHADNEMVLIQEEHRSELMPVLLRVLYGQAINRSGARSNRADEGTKRKTIWRALSRVRNSEIKQFIAIAFRPLASFLPPDPHLPLSSVIGREIITDDQQHGILNMIYTMLKVLEGRANEFAEETLNVVMYCLVRACWSSVERRASSPQDPEIRDTLVKRRRLGLQCLVAIFKNAPQLDWELYLPMIFSEAISPRLQQFPIETAQGVSSLLQLFATWASSSRFAPFLVNYETTLLDTLADCLVVSSAREDVRVFIMDQILTKLARPASKNTEDTMLADVEPAEGSTAILQPHLEHVLERVRCLLDSEGNGRTLESASSTLLALTPFAMNGEAGINMLATISTVLSRSLGRFGLKMKSRLLQSMRTLLCKYSLTIDIELRNTIYSTVSALFIYFRDDQERIVLCDVLRLIAEDPIAEKVASLCAKFHARSNKTLDEIDYDQRLAAFDAVQGPMKEHIKSGVWLPILHNLLYFANSSDDFAIRSNTIASIRGYIEHSCELEDSTVQGINKKVLLPALKKGLKGGSETFRADHVGLLGLLISKCPDWPELSDMTGLLAYNDDEASFFNNILHIQHHRRVRALRRLVVEVESGRIRSSSISGIFLPLLERFILDVDDARRKNQDEGTSNLIGPTVEAIETLISWTEWNQFRSIFLKYRTYLKSKPHIEKIIIKLLDACANSLHRACSNGGSTKLAQGNEAAVREEELQRCRLSNTLPVADQIAGEMTDNIIPVLASYVHNKDESEISLRIPICIAVAKLLAALDTSRQALILPPLLLDVSYILRSRSQDSRDTARRTLAKIVTILGPSCLPFVLKELRSALTRGYQLHVLSFTVHSILVTNAESLKLGDLDNCLSSLISIVMDDIFGIVGQEKEAEEYTRKPKEVKTSKSYDSMELIAKSVSLECVIQLLVPIQSLFFGRLAAKQVRQVDELLRRIGLGLTRNPASKSKDILVLIYQVMQKFYLQPSYRAESHSTKHEMSESKFLVQFPAYRVEQIEQTAFSNKVIRFALDLLRSILHKHEGLCTPENVQGLVPVIGDALLQIDEEAKISALRLLSSIVRLDLPELDRNAQLFLFEAVKVIKDSPVTGGEISHAALKLITSYLRERPQAIIRDSDLAYLLKRIIPDLEEPDRQGVTFNFVKAVMARQFVLPEVYELMDKVAIMMVSNHTRNARDMARGAFVYFLLHYPQSKSRWSKQLKFLVKNLEYKYPEGRQSVMEAANVLLARSRPDIAGDIINALFVPVILITVNDESADCRNIASALLGQFLKKADAVQANSLVAPIRSWLEQSDNVTLTVAGLQAFEVVLDMPDLQHLVDDSFLRSCVFQMLGIPDTDVRENTWEATFHALQLILKLDAVFPGSVMNQAYAAEWAKIAALLNHRHPWVQSTAAKLIGSWFHDVAGAGSDNDLNSMPLTSTHGLQLNETTILGIMRSSLRSLKAENSSKELTAQCIRNLVFTGRYFSSNGAVMPKSQSGEKDEHDDKSISSSSESSPSDVDERNGHARSQPRLAIHYLLYQVAAILRREPSSRKPSALRPKTLALQLLFALIHHTSPSLLAPVIQSILLPLAHLTDQSIPAPLSSGGSDPTTSIATTHTSLTSSAHEILDLLRSKLGNAAYVSAMTATQRWVRERREARRAKRRIETVASPERAGRKKVKRNERKRDRRRERAEEMRSWRKRGW